MRAVLLLLLWSSVHSFVPHAKQRLPAPFWAKKNEDDEDLEVAGDWRSFRAKLVRSEQAEDEDVDGIGSLFSETWAYDSGNIIEQGSVILGGVEQDFGFGLRQQYFHKVAILVLDHDPATFTKGIILNRPTDLWYEDAFGVKWKVWFGGDVQGLDSNHPDVICLHSLQLPEGSSFQVLNEAIQWTSFEQAQKLVQDGFAQPTDFWVFCGYAGWGAGQLAGELERKSWYMVTTDPQTLWKELRSSSQQGDPRDAGLETWTLLMNMMGRSETAEESSGDFVDHMLKEWALQHLMSSEAGGGAGSQRRTTFTRVPPTLDVVLGRRGVLLPVEDVAEGAILRASSADRSPFLLDYQEFHKSVVLVIGESDSITLGVILNRPVAQSLEIQISKSGASRTVRLPIRFGGTYSPKGSQSVLWLHNSPKLREANVGKPVGRQSGVWKCNAEAVTDAISKNLAEAEDFLVVSGVSVWPKGMRNDVEQGTFEPVPVDRVENVWSALLKQAMLEKTTLLKSISQANEAWAAGADPEAMPASIPTPIAGLGENFDEEDESLVYKSNVKVSSLSDDALRSWIAAFLLNSPTLGA